MPINKNNTLLIACNIFLMSFSKSAISEGNISVIPFVEAGYDHYTLELSGDIPLPEGGFVKGSNEYVFDFPTIRAGLVVSSEKWSGNIYVRKTGEAKDILDFDEVPGAPIVNWTGERDDSGATLSYKFDAPFSIFAGYREASTTGTGSFNSAYDFTNDGYFLGLDYMMSITDSGGLTLSYAYTWLDVELSQKVAFFTLPNLFGDGDGIKLSVVWSDLLSERWGYTIRMEYFDYEFDLDPKNDSEGGAVTMTETETMYNLGLFYVF
ncbi:hypothetical protein [Oceanicoccus sagamiensis]|uniref:Outer membrane protein beta-barrel domain-containing protein n=1 Tax=Oceanicoccus sagamiensis TaxID=716816 RepID=A0A1X9NKV9_9GAMM|nr:hypothetical protein [Oceanicoccus sagamiensis]ARN76059.1 hypothetical protein BST96_19335 [Oceanicoccus sagamiensis]